MLTTTTTTTATNIAAPTTTTATTTTANYTTTATTKTATTIGGIDCGSGSKKNMNAKTAVAVLAVLSFMFTVALLVLVTRYRKLSTQIMHLQQKARGNCHDPLQTTSNPLHQGYDNTYEDAVCGQEAIYMDAKIEKGNASIEEPYELLNAGAQTYVMGETVTSA
jgi:hypothetical protein